jgi:hypothetical protein
MQKTEELKAKIRSAISFLEEVEKSLDSLNNIDNIKKELSNFDVEIREEEGKIVIMPKSFLGKKKFTEVLEISKKYGGKYISNGKKSRFEIPK